MTFEFRFEMVVIWDSCRVQQLNLPQHNVSRSGLLLDQVYMKGESGWITVNPTVLPVYNAAPFFQSTTQRMMPSYQIIKYFVLKNSQCFSHVWWWYGTPIKRNNGAFHPTYRALFKHLHKDVQRWQIWARSFKRDRWKWNQDMTSWLFWAFYTLARIVANLFATDFDFFQWG